MRLVGKIAHEALLLLVVDTICVRPGSCIVGTGAKVSYRLKLSIFGLCFPSSVKKLNMSVDPVRGNPKAIIEDKGLAPELTRHASCDGGW